MTEEQTWMKEAIQQANLARMEDEVPIGCVIVHDHKIIGTGRNRREELQLSTAHAEIQAIEEACKALGSWRLEDCDLYVTLEPCPMCAGAIIQSRIRHVYFGASDPKGGSVSTCTSLFEIPQYNHHPLSTGGILEEECAEMLSDFFREKRQKQKEKKRKEKEASENGISGSVS